jgi:hypothetical protein
MFGHTVKEGSETTDYYESCDPWALADIEGMQADIVAGRTAVISAPEHRLRPILLTAGCRHPRHGPHDAIGLHPAE